MIVREFYRERKDGSFGMARPCPACRIAIKNLGIKIIHYTCNENSIATEYLF